MTNTGPWKKAVMRASLLKVPCLFGLFRCPVEVNSIEWVDTFTPPGRQEEDEFDDPQNNEGDDDRR